jgi:hypothetical protein
LLSAPLTFLLGEAASIGFLQIGGAPIGGVGATRTLVAPPVSRSIKAPRMPNAGDYLPYSTPGEVQPYSIDFATQLPVGDAIAGVVSSLVVAEQTRLGFGGSDTNPAANLVGSASFFGTVCTQTVGPLQANVVYRLTFSVVTTAGRTLINYAHICCLAPS